MEDVKPNAALSALCSELQALQRQRAVFIKSRIMRMNRLQAIIAGTIGYHSGMTEAERLRVFGEAGKLIKRVAAGDEGVETDSPNAGLRPLILTHHVGIPEMLAMQASLEKEMLKAAKQLPVAAWVEQPEQKGFGLPSLAVLIGETGNLDNYANPGKVWRRMGAAPKTFGGKTLMGATWRSGKEGKLPAAEWEEFGYSPRRRSIMYLFGENLMKGNRVGGGAGDGRIETDQAGAGPYRSRYDEAKALAAEKHPDWIRCSKCDGTGRTKSAKCANCKGTGEVWKRCHLHGMLLASKLLVKNLWIEWRE
jgi:hypothetical protein